MVNVQDMEDAIVGGMVAGKVVKTTRTNSIMAFVTLEDLYGSVEVIFFPQNYEKYKDSIVDDAKVFIKGRITVEEDKPAKLIANKVIEFGEVPREVWVKFKDRESFFKSETSLQEIINIAEGNDMLTIYCEKERSIKRIPHIKADFYLIDKINQEFGIENVKVVESSIEKVK